MAERLIRESDVIKLIDEWLDNYPLPRHVEKGLQSHGELLAYIADAPTIEAKPVVHAHWEDGKCSNCENEAVSRSWDEPIYDYDWDESLQYSYTEHHTEYELTAFCPYCGAQMDENHIAEVGKKEPICGCPQEGVKIPVISMEDVPKLAKEMEKMKKVMISQPMSGLNDATIKETRRKATEKLRKEGYEVADSYFTEEWIALNAGGIKNKPLWCLAKSLEVMSHCDTVYFCKGWLEARGCRIEHEAAVAYGLEIYEE